MGSLFGGLPRLRRCDAGCYLWFASCAFNGCFCAPLPSANSDVHRSRVEAAPYDFLHRAGEITDQRRAPRSASAAAERVPRRAL